jgi:hypothetical protein
MLDLRLPIGFYFLINAAILIATGLISQPEASLFCGARINLDVIWGLIMAAFGALMLGLFLMEKKKSKAE